jgi:hypothetical protein
MKFFKKFLLLFFFFLLPFVLLLLLLLPYEYMLMPFPHAFSLIAALIIIF